MSKFRVYGEYRKKLTEEISENSREDTSQMYNLMSEKL